MRKENDTSPCEGMTPAQAFILDKFATIQAELECIMRETERAREILTNKDARKNG